MGKHQLIKYLGTSGNQVYAEELPRNRVRRKYVKAPAKMKPLPKLTKSFPKPKKSKKKSMEDELGANNWDISVKK